MARTAGLLECAGLSLTLSSSDRPGRPDGLPGVEGYVVRSLTAQYMP